MQVSEFSFIWIVWVSVILRLRRVSVMNSIVPVHPLNNAIKKWVVLVRPVIILVLRQIWRIDAHQVASVWRARLVLIPVKVGSITVVVVILKAISVSEPVNCTYSILNIFWRSQRLCTTAIWRGHKLLFHSVVKFRLLSLFWVASVCPSVNPIGISPLNKVKVVNKVRSVLLLRIKNLSETGIKFSLRLLLFLPLLNRNLMIALHDFLAQLIIHNIELWLRRLVVVVKLFIPLQEKSGQSNTVKF